MSDKIKKGLVDDCPPEEKGGGKKGPIVRADKPIEFLQRQLGMQGSDVDGMLGKGTSAAIAEKFGNVNDPEILKALPADIRGAIEEIQEKAGRGMFTQHIKDPGECAIDDSGGGLLHEGGKLDIPNMHMATPPDMAVVEPPLKRPPAQEGQALKTDEGPLARPKYNEDGSKFGTDPAFREKGGLLGVGPGPALGGGGVISTPKETAPATIDPSTREAFKGIENYDGGGQGKIMRLDQIDPGPVEIKRLDQIEVGPVENIPVAANLTSNPATFNSAATDTSSFVGNVVHDAGIALKSAFTAARDYLGASPLDNPDPAPSVAVAANLTVKPMSLSA